MGISLRPLPVPIDSSYLAARVGTDDTRGHGELGIGIGYFHAWQFLGPDLGWDQPTQESCHDTHLEY